MELRMATYRKVGARWRAEVAKSGVRKSKVFDTKSEARRWADQIEELVVGVGHSKSKSLGELLDDYKDRVSIQKLGCRWEQTRIKRWLRGESTALRLERRTDEITPDDIGRWRDELGLRVQSGSVIREMALMRSVFEHARLELRWIHLNPVDGAKKPKSPKPRTRVLLPGESERLLAAMDYIEGEAPKTLMQECAYAMLIALETAMRSGEIVSLGQENLMGKYLRLFKTKNGDERDVPLSARARELLSKLPSSGALFRLTDGTRDATWRKAMKKAGITGLTFHDLRRVATTRLAEKLEPMELAKMTGHRDLKILMAVYYAKAPGAIADKL